MKIIDNSNIQVEKLELEIENTGHITNTYIIKDKKTSKVCVVDPAFNEAKIIDKIEEINGVLDLVVITHSHADHISALASIVKNKDIKVYVHELDYEGLYNKELNQENIVQTKVIPVEKGNINLVIDQSIITLGNTKLEVIHTPGHTNGSICLLDSYNNILYSGDTIFEKSYGRTDFITGSHQDMKKSLEKLYNKFEDIIVLSGHGNIFNYKDSKRKIMLLFAYKG